MGGTGLNTLLLAGLCFFLAFVSAHGDLKFVQDTCSGIPPSNFCMDALLSDPRSLTADFAGLGAISLQLSAKNATATLATIGNLLKNQSLTDDARSSLTNCLLQYGYITTEFNTALEKSNAKDYPGAKLQVSYAQTSSKNCEEGFNSTGYPSSLTQENKFTDSLALLSDAFLRQP